MRTSDKAGLTKEEKAAQKAREDKAKANAKKRKSQEEEEEQDEDKKSQSAMTGFLFHVKQ